MEVNKNTIPTYSRAMTKRQFSSTFSSWTCRVCILILLYTAIPYVDAAIWGRYNTGSRSRVPAKRLCQGFPCMYTHLGSKAGHAAVYKALMQMIDRCLRNPNCIPSY